MNIPRSPFAALVAGAALALSSLGFAALPARVTSSSPVYTNGVLVLSFDDRNFADWEAALPIFDKYGAHATFFICGHFDTNAVRFAKLVRAHGHSVGLHGVYHASADKEIAKRGADAYYDYDIAPQKKACEAAGIPVHSFAYPNSRRTDEADALFFRKGFDRVRGSIKGLRPYDPKGIKMKENGLKPILEDDRAFFPVSDLPKHRLFGTIILGSAYHTDIDEFVACIRRIAKRNEVFIITSHDVSANPKPIGMKTEWLEKLLATAIECGVAVLGFDELPPPAEARQIADSR